MGRVRGENPHITQTGCGEIRRKDNKVGGRLGKKRKKPLGREKSQKSKGMILGCRSSRECGGKTTKRAKGRARLSTRGWESMKRGRKDAQGKIPQNAKLQLVKKR